MYVFFFFFFSNLCVHQFARCSSPLWIEPNRFLRSNKMYNLSNDKYVNWRNGKWRYVNYGKWNKRRKKNISTAVYSEWHLLIAFCASTSTSRNKKGAILLMMIFATMIYRVRGRFLADFTVLERNLFYTIITCFEK